MSEAVQSAKRLAYPTIPDTLRSFRGVGASTPMALTSKLDIFLGHHARARTALILFDAFRCSSTLIAAFSNGARAALIHEKGIDDEGRSLSAARGVSQALGCDVVFGGELNGAPIDGGCIGNSPLACLAANELTGNLLYFRSTNLGRAWVEMVSAVERHQADATIFLVSFENAAATARHIIEGEFNFFFFGSGGFFENVAFEDLALGGKVIDSLNLSIDDLDDEATSMFASHLLARSQPYLLTQTWTARVLRAIHKYDDVHHILHPEVFPEPHKTRMKETIIGSEKIAGETVLSARK